MEKITSRTNPLMTHIRKLSSAAYRRETGEYLCDSPKLLAEAVQWGAEIVTVVATAEAELPALSASVRCVEVPRDVMESISPMKTPQGVLFTCRLPATALPAKPEGKRYMVLDGVQDPGNVGTIWRTADAAGFEAMLVGAGSADPMSPKVQRSAMGSAFRVPLKCGNMVEMLMEKKAQGYRIVASALDGTDFRERINAGEKAILIVGNEARGISPEVMALADVKLRLPMLGKAESLNAAVAAGIFMYQMAVFEKEK